PTEVDLGPNQHTGGTAAIATADEIDWYHFTAPLTGNYEFRTTAASGLYAYIGVYDSGGHHVGIDANSGGDLSSLLDITLTSGQGYYYAVTDAGSGTGAYGWSIAGPDGLYEDNDTFATAADLGTFGPDYRDFDHLALI